MACSQGKGGESRGLWDKLGVKSMLDKLAWEKEICSNLRWGSGWAGWPMKALGGWPVCWGPEAGPTLWTRLPGLYPQTSCWQSLAGNTLKA